MGPPLAQSARAQLLKGAGFDSRSGEGFFLLNFLSSLDVGKVIGIITFGAR